MDFQKEFRDGWVMDKQEHADRLRSAIARSGLSRKEIGAIAGRTARTVTNWTSGDTMPSELEKALLRDKLGNYDAEGDPVEAAVRGTRLTEDRQYDVIGYYKRKLREQDEESGRREPA